MTHISWSRVLAACSLLLGAASSVAAQPDSSVIDGMQALPADKEALVPEKFVDEIILEDLNQAVGFTFASDGRMYLWEKDGVVWIVEDGALQQPPFLDLREEVASWGSQGLMGFALDPAFYTNGFVYLLYSVDYHHLTTFGTPSYDPNVSLDFVDTVGRITRFTAHSADGFRTADPASRHILLGDAIGNGFPLCSDGHSIGTLLFGDDGTLLAGCGESAGAPASGTCVSDGILKPFEDVGSFAAQYVDSLLGKIIRIDPASGDGLPGNPYYDPQEPRAARSRVWSLGLRNPWRFTLRQGTGSTNPVDADPGTLYIGDVGSGIFEELDIARGPGRNFGWPVFEGHLKNPVLGSIPTDNLAAPNPLLGFPIVGVGICNQEYYRFQDLIIQDTLDRQPYFPNPCDPSTPLYSSQPTMVHTRPAIAWAHFGGAATPGFDAFGAPIAIPLGPQSPVSGPDFGGNCSIGGSWYTGSEFPPEYSKSYFHADYGLGWIYNFTLDNNERLAGVSVFAEPAGRVVCIGEDRTDGSLYYLDFTDLGLSRLRRIWYAPDNAPPLAEISSSQLWGPSPMTVAFDGGQSSDPEGQALSYDWQFSDGTTRSLTSATARTFPSEDITEAGTIIGRVLKLTPPMPMGVGNLDPEIIRDNVWAPVGSIEYDLQFDTAHFLPGYISDKGGFDWLGYKFPVEREFTGLIFQEGVSFSPLGGWFDSFELQVLQQGQWQTVDNVTVMPSYALNAPPDSEIFEFFFPPVSGRGLRLFGHPGGLLEFVGFTELRVMASPLAPSGLPTNSQVTLTVTDSAGATASETVTVSVDNSPPMVEILSPATLSTYSNAVPDVVQLTGTMSDAEHSPGQLSCTWQVILHHDNHNHPGALLSGCAQTAILSTDGCPDMHYQEIVYTVTDPLGLVGSKHSYLIPECDLNMNGVHDAVDIGSGDSHDNNADGIPDEAQVDCNDNGLSDLQELFFGYVEDLNNNGIPDECDPAVITGVGHRGKAP